MLLEYHVDSLETSSGEDTYRFPAAAHMSEEGGTWIVVESVYYRVVGNSSIKTLSFQGWQSGNFPIPQELRNGKVET